MKNQKKYKNHRSLYRILLSLPNYQSSFFLLLLQHCYIFNGSFYEIFFAGIFFMHAYNRN